MKTGEILRILALENMELVDYSAPFRFIQYDMMYFGDDNDRFRETFIDYPFHLYCLNEADDLEQFHTEVGVLFRALQFRKDRKGLKQLLQNNVEYRHVDKDTLEAIAVLLDMPSIWEERYRYMIQNENDREGYNMCLAVREWAEEFAVVKNLLSRGISEEEIMLIAECDQKFVLRVKDAM